MAISIYQKTTDLSPEPTPTMESTIEDIDEDFQAEVMDALESMQTEKTSLKKGVLTFVLTLLAFIGLWLLILGVS